MATVTVLANASRAVGSYQSLAADFPLNDNRIAVSCDRAAFASLSRGTDVLRIAFDVSQDAGSNWSPLFSFTTDGGEIVGNGGTVVARSEIAGVYVPGAGNADRKVRVRLVLLAALTTSVRIDTYSGPEPTPHAPLNSVAHAQSSDASGTAVTGYTASLTIAADADRLVYAAVGANDNEVGLGGSPAVVWNVSETLTDISPASSWPYVTAAFNDDGIRIWRKVAPTATAANLDFTGHTSGNRLYFAWVVLYGVHQTVPEGTATLNYGTTGSSATGSCTGSASGMAVGICFHSRSASPTLADGGGQTARAEEEGIGSRCAGSIATIAGGGTLNYDWTLGGSGSTEAWGVVCAPFAPSSTPASPRAMHSYRQRRV